MEIEIIETTDFIKRIKCKHCGHEWVPRKEVVGCPKCKYGYYKARKLKKTRADQPS